MKGELLRNVRSRLNFHVSQSFKVFCYYQRDKRLLLLENVSEDDDSLNLQNGRISNKATENEEIGEGVETNKQNGVDIDLSSIWSELLQDNKDLNSKVPTSSPMLTMDSSSAMNHSDFHASEVQDEVFNTQDGEFLSVLEDLMDLDDPLHS